MRIASAPVLAALAWSATGSIATAQPFGLPISAPEDAGPVVSDFLELCSQAMLDRDAAAAEAVRRDWQDVSEEIGGESEFAREYARSFVKPTDEALPPTLVLTQIGYPHTLMRGCTLQISDKRLSADIDTRVIDRIPGFLTREDLRTDEPQGDGHRSVRDETGSIVTLSVVTNERHGLTDLSMFRDRDRDPPNGEPRP